MGNLVDACLARALRAWAPPPDLTVSEWAERHAMLAAESSAEPGKWHAIPYQVAMMDACCHPKIERVTIKKSARIGYTKIIGNVIGRHIHQDPCSILVVQPTIDDAEGWSKEEFTPTVEQTDVLRSLISSSRERDSSNTILRKMYRGGILHVVGANSARGFRRITVRIVIFDELDGYPPTAGKEGDQEKLGEMRAETAWNRKIIKGSTPTEAGFSRIERSWSESSQGHYLVPCPECGTFHVRRFFHPVKQVVLRGRSVPVSWMEIESACWVCPECNIRISHAHHRAMVEKGYWLGEDWEWSKEDGFSFLPGFSGHVGMFMWAGYSYSPNSTPKKLIAEYLESKDDAEKLKTFVNTKLGEVWEEKGEQVDYQILKARSEKYVAEVPNGVIIITCGVDIQSDRIELEVVGWGFGEESWSIDYHVIIGDPVQDDVWDELMDVLKTWRWSTADGSQMRIIAMCVDSGYLPKRVYRFVAASRMEHIYAVKGRDGAYPVIEQKLARQRRLAKRKKGGAAPEMIGVDEAKAVLSSRLKITKPGPGYCHFPDDRDDEWYKQLCGEKLITRYPRGGRPVREWIKVHSAVEALDNRNYAYAAMLLSGVDLTSRPAATQPDAPQPQRQARATQRPQRAGRLIR